MRTIYSFSDHQKDEIYVYEESLENRQVVTLGHGPDEAIVHLSKEDARDMGNLLLKLAGEG